MRHHGAGYDVENVGIIWPHGDRLLIRRPPPVEEETSNGVIHPAAWSEHATDPIRGELHGFGMRRWNAVVECEVLAVGPGEKDGRGTVAPTWVRPGDNVLLTSAPIDSIDERHCFVREREVLAVVRRTGDSMTIDAASDRLLLEVPKTQTHSGVIIIPEQCQRKAWSGTVISAGPGAWAVERDRNGITTMHGGKRRLRLRNGKPYRIDHGVEPGAFVRCPPDVSSVELDIGERHLLLVLTVDSVAYQRAA